VPRIGLSIRDANGLSNANANKEMFVPNGENRLCLRGLNLTRKVLHNFREWRFLFPFAHEKKF